MTDFFKDLSSSKKKSVGVIYGGRSVEHEISVISALQAMKVLDVTRYNIVPIYISPSGRWFTGKALHDKSTYTNFASRSHLLNEVIFYPRPGRTKLHIVNNSFKSKLLDLISCHNNEIEIDVFLTVFHGEYGEDGCIQGLFEMADAAYTSCEVLASSLSMDKYICKSILRDHGIDVLPAFVAYKQDAIKNLDKLTQDILSDPKLGGFPLFIKPNHLGSSIGIGKATDQNSLHQCLARVFLHDSQAIIEPCLHDMFEINVSVMDGDSPTASVVEIPVSSSGALSFEDKYLRDGGKKKGYRKPQASEGMASLTRDIDPKGLSQDIKDKVRSTALKAFKILNCSGVARFDFMHDNTSGKIYFNELNPQPGSLSFYLWIKSDPPYLYTEELTRVIEAAERRRSDKASREKEIGFRALR